jgi:hypothetical protein
MFNINNIGDLREKALSQVISQIYRTENICFVGRYVFDYSFLYRITIFEDYAFVLSLQNDTQFRIDISKTVEFINGL